MPNIIIFIPDNYNKKINLLKINRNFNTKKELIENMIKECLDNHLKI